MGKIQELPLNWGTQYNYQIGEGVINDKPSLTIPNEALTISEMLQKVQNGLVLEGLNLPYVDENSDVPQIKDYTDLDEHLRIIKNIQNKIDAQVSEKAALEAARVNKEKIKSEANIEGFLKDK